MKKIIFQPGDHTYQWSTKLKNAFAKRSLPYDTTNNNDYLKLVKLQDKFYSILFNNKKSSYQKRFVQKNYPKRNKEKTVQSFSVELPWNTAQIQKDFSFFLSTIIAAMEKDAESLYEQAKLLDRICQEEGVQIPVISTFDSIGSWEEFIELLHSFGSKDDPAYFELVIALIIQYAKLCS